MKRFRLASFGGPALNAAFPLVVFLAWQKLQQGHFTALLYWPTVVSSAFLIFFGRTLWTPPPMVERFARLQKADLSEAEVLYCKRVTQVWCLFFILNGSLAFALTFRTSLKAWALYSGLISYLLIGTLMASEYLYRHWRFRPEGALLTRWMNRWFQGTSR